MRLSRRQWVGVAAAGAAVRAAAQAPAAAPDTPGEMERAALDSVRKTSARIRKIKLPIDTEPAFSFRAQ